MINHDTLYSYINMNERLSIMALQKTEQIRRYLTRNDNEHIKDMIENRISVKDISNYFNTSKQLVYNILDDLDYADIQERRYDYMKKQSERVHHLLMEGIPLDYLWDIGELDCFKPYTTQKTSMYIFKQLLVRKFIKYGIIQENDLDAIKHLMISIKLKSYVEALQIGWLLENKDITFKEICEMLDASITRVSNINVGLVHSGTPLPKLPKTLVDTVKRNVDICLAHHSGQSIETLAKTFDLDELVIKYIISGTLEYVHFENGLENMYKQPQK